MYITEEEYIEVPHTETYIYIRMCAGIYIYVYTHIYSGAAH